MLRVNGVTQRVAGLDDEEIVALRQIGIVAVVGHRYRVIERVAEAMRKEEVQPGKGQFLHRRVTGIGRVKLASGRNPPVTISIQVNIAALVTALAAEDGGGIRQ